MNPKFAFFIFISRLISLMASAKDNTAPKTFSVGFGRRARAISSKRFNQPRARILECERNSRVAHTLPKPSALPAHRISLSTMMLMTGALTVTFAVMSFLVFSKDLALPRVGAAYIESELAVDPTSKASFLARLEGEQLRDLASRVHFISGIIASTRQKTQDAKELAYAIVTESKLANIDPLLVAAIIKSESTFKRNARSSVGARGLMQLLPATARYISDLSEISWSGTSKLNDPHYNIRLGINYLQYLLKRFNGDMERALIAYNWGPGNLLSASRTGREPPMSTIRYADKIGADYSRWSYAFSEYREKPLTVSARYLES